MTEARTPSSSRRQRPDPAQRSARRFRRIRADHSREVAEDYVELIDDLITESGEARAVDIADRIGVSHVTVTKTIGRLQRDGLVTSAPYRSIFLTATGKKLADHARQRHEMVLAFLLALGVPKADAEADAEGIEHHLSAATLDKMNAFLRKNRG